MNTTTNNSSSSNSYIVPRLKCTGVIVKLTVMLAVHGRGDFANLDMYIL